jgi:hypothetical protein
MINYANKDHDFVFASRYAYSGGSTDDTALTYIGNKIFTLLGNILFKLKISDILFTYILGNTKKFKELIKQGIKIIFKPKKKDIVLKSEKLTKILNDNTEDLANFSKIISEIILEEQNPYLSEVYELIVNNVKKEDILFL